MLNNNNNNNNNNNKGSLAGSCEHGHETSCSIKGGEFLDYLSYY
jgi:hypothetical protein